MNIGQQVVNLELAKRLKELGVEQKSLFFYLNIDGEGIYYIYYDEQMPEEYEYEGDPISAFTVAELGEILPKRIAFNGIYSFLTQIPSANLKYWCLFYRNDFSSVEGLETHDETEANVRAKMLIYLLENSLIKI